MDGRQQVEKVHEYEWQKGKMFYWDYDIVVHHFILS